MKADLSIADQRDRFLTFAFAASDVLIEVDNSGTIVFVAGSVKNLLGQSVDELMGSPIDIVAAEGHRIVLKEYLIKLIETGRASDRLINVGSNDDKKKITQISVSGMSSPQRPGIHHLAFKKVPLAARRAQGQVPSSPMMILDFANSAASLSSEARTAGEELNFAMYDVDWDTVENAVSKEKAEELNDTLVKTLRAWASGGSGVGQVGDGKFSLLLDEGIDPETLSKRIAAVAKEADDSLNLDVNHAALSVSDVIDTDDFDSFFKQAMERFDEVGGEKFDLLNFNELPGKKKWVPPPSDTMPARSAIKRKGMKESWG